MNTEAQWIGSCDCSKAWCLGTCTGCTTITSRTHGSRTPSTKCAGCRGVFAHMFDTLEQPRFRITTRIVQGRECFLAWEFRFGLRPRGDKEVLVRGGSHLKLANDGRIAWHRDYWDAAEELYEQMPVLGALMRWLKRRAAA